MTFLLARPARSRGRRRFATLLAIASTALVVLTGLTAAPSAQAAGSSSEQQFVSSINSARRSAGRATLSTSGDLTAVARAWAATMASSNTLRHNPRLTSQVTGWRYVGENVGMGGDVASLHQAFMASAPHRANILDKDFTQVGVGVATGHGRLWVVEVFRRPSTASSASRVPTTKHTAKKPASSASSTKRPKSTTTTKSTTTRKSTEPSTTKTTRSKPAKSTSPTKAIRPAKGIVYRPGSRGGTVKKIQVGVRADGQLGG